jgi:hypothetical protein
MLQQAGKTFQTELLKMHPNYKQVEGNVKQANPFDKKYSADIERTTVMVSMRIETAEDKLTLNTNETYTLALNTSDSGVLEIKVSRSTNERCHMIKGTKMALNIT